MTEEEKEKEAVNKITRKGQFFENNTFNYRLN